MKMVRLFMVAALVSAFATASFAGSCCSNKKAEDCDKPKAETQEQKK